MIGQLHVSTISGQGKFRTPIQTITVWHSLLAASYSHYAYSSTHMVPTRFRERIGIFKFRNRDSFDALGAAIGPGVNFVHPFQHAQIY